MTVVEYEYIEKRTTKTLARWWWELACWRWPEQLQPEEGRGEPGTPRRYALMRRIESVVAWRTMRPIIHPPKELTAK